MGYWHNKLAVLVFIFLPSFKCGYDYPSGRPSACSYLTMHQLLRWLSAWGVRLRITCGAAGERKRWNSCRWSDCRANCLWDLGTIFACKIITALEQPAEGLFSTASDYIPHGRKSTALVSSLTGGICWELCFRWLKRHAGIQQGRTFYEKQLNTKTKKHTRPLRAPTWKKKKKRYLIFFVRNIDFNNYFYL